MQTLWEMSEASLEGSGGEKCVPCSLLAVTLFLALSNSKEGKKAHVLTHEVVMAVQYNAIRESTMPKRVPRSSGRHNDFGLKPSSYECVTFDTALLILQWLCPIYLNLALP